VRDLANIEELTQLPNLLAIIAARAGSILNVADISRTARLSNTTLTRYLTLLETAFLVYRLPAWSGNLTSRFIKAPKMLLNDTGLAAHLLGLSETRLQNDPNYLGGLLDNFVGMEILKSIGSSQTRPSLYHWQTMHQTEVNLLLERRNGDVVGIEVKASGTVGPNDFKGLRSLQAQIGEKFVRGLVVYTGDRTVPFGEKLFALPISVLWH